MAKLVLIKHALPVIEPDVPSPRWVLSDEGRGRCAWLAGELMALGVRRIYSSVEPKALETAALVGLAMGLEVRSRAGLQENDRTGLAFGTAGELRRRIRQFFATPADLVIGHETAQAALARFDAAVRALIAEAPEEHAAVVTHGTVLTLLTAAHNAIEPFAFWNALSLPACVVLDASSLRLQEPPRLYLD